MPTVATMTDTIPQPIPEPPPRSRSSSGSTTPTRGTRRMRRAYAQPTFHLNIGRVDIPRSMPPVRTLGTQTDESALREVSIEDKKLYRRTWLFTKKWIFPVVTGIVTILSVVFQRVGFGIRVN